jgi:phage terminase large subunit-like protein
VNCIVAGDTFDTTRDILQAKLLGPPRKEGTGLIPKEWIDFSSIIRETQGAIDQFAVKHVSGQLSTVSIKTYMQGVEAFFGVERDVIWLDEIVPREIYAECVARTRNRPGARIITTFTPKKGKTPLVRMFLEEPAETRKWYKIGWDSAPHLDDEYKKNILENTPQHMIAAVRDGEPTQGAGAVYPVPWSKLVVDPFQIPAHWRWIVGFDGGFYNTAFVWIAWNPDTDVAYVVSDYCDGGVDTKLGPIDVSVHAARFKARSKALFGSENIPVIGDAAARDQTDGTQILQEYAAYGIRIVLPVKAVEAGVNVVRTRILNDQLKVLSTCVGWRTEFEGYHYEYDEDTETAKIRKQRDHRMDATRYTLHHGLKYAIAKFDMRESTSSISGVRIRR